MVAAGWPSPGSENSATLISAVRINCDWRLIPILEKIERTCERTVLRLVAALRAVSRDQHKASALEELKQGQSAGRQRSGYSR